MDEELHRLGDGEMAAVLARRRGELAPGGTFRVRAAVAIGAPSFERSDERLELLRRRASYEDAFAAAGLTVVSREDVARRRRYIVCAWVLKASG